MDSTDGIQGLNGIGPKKASKLMEGWHEGYSESFILTLYIDHYKSKSKGIFEFQKNFRLLKMLSTDEEFLREVGYLPTLDNIQFVNKVKQEELELNF